MDDNAGGWIVIEHILQDAAAMIRHTEQTLEVHRRNRDSMIIRAHAEGLSLRRIGELAGVSHQTVANVVAAGASTTTETNCRPPVE